MGICLATSKLGNLCLLVIQRSIQAAAGSIVYPKLNYIVRLRGPLAAATALGISLFIEQSGVAGNGALTRIAVTGQQATFSQDVSYFRRFGRPPTLNNAGQVAFTGSLQGSAVNSSNDTGLWKTLSDQDLTVVAREGDTLASLPGDVRYGGFGAPALNDEGQIALRGILIGADVDSTNSGAMWIDSGLGELSLLVREGDRASETDSDLRFEFFQSPVLSNTGQIAFRAYTDFDFPGDRGIWRVTDAGLELLVHKGNKYSDAFDPFYDFSNPVVSDNGDVAFEASFTGNETPDGLFRYTAERELIPIVQEGDLASEFAPGVMFRNLWAPVINGHGHTAFLAVMRSDTSSLPIGESVWKAEKGGALNLVASTISEAPGDPQRSKFTYFIKVVLNNAGDIAFVGGTGGDETLDDGVWSDAKREGLSVIVREGQSAPGTLGSFKDFEQIVLNNNGQTAFFAEFSDPVQGSGIWAEDIDGVLQLIVKTGDFLNVSDAQSNPLLKEVVGLAFNGSTGNGDGRPSGFNDHGQVAFTARFADGSEGIFLSNRLAVPEPETVDLFVLGAALALSQRRIRNCRRLHRPNAFSGIHSNILSYSAEEKDSMPNRFPTWRSWRFGG